MISAFEQEIRRGLWYIAPPEKQEKQAATAGGDIVLPAVIDDDDLDRVLRDFLGVKLPNKRCCQTHRTPWDAVHDAFFARSAVSVWKASRGMGGKSFTLSALAMAEALFLRADVNILGGSGDQSERILEAIGKLWGFSGFPSAAMRGKQPSALRQTTIWGNKIVALKASQASVRGPHPQRLRLDEVDEMKLAILDSALGQPMSLGHILAQVVMSSTHQYPAGTMAAVLKRAAENGYPVFEWCYRENLEPHGWLSMAEVERKRAILPSKMWETEIELQEPSAEGRAIETEKVELAFVSVLAEDLVVNQSELVVIEEPVADGKYATGADWAKKKNHSVFVTIRHDVEPARVVCVRRTQKRPWPDMVADYDWQVKKYGGTAAHDNTGLGQVVDDLLTVHAEAFDMVGRQRANMLTEYVASVEKRELIWPRCDASPVLSACYGEHKYATREDLYKGSKDGSTKWHLPDTISAGGLAWRAAGGVEAASATRQPAKNENKHLQAGIQRGRLLGYGLQRHGLADSADAMDDDDMDDLDDDE